ncbi:MAG: 2-oxo acid dehydrogenase subunit E2 [Rhodospirillaceae bacterium]|nr:2-oxo acid dehydrogenase subunit E2 [Rhodospirillaceae bacterium]MBL6940582.1 2-oxo acid dehydrogenase subunit E2 [Rhodospirillales bacterium]
MSTFNLPDLGEGLQDAEIVAWHVSVNDNVVTDQPLVSVETDKAVVEVPAPHSGRIARLYGEAGQRIGVDAPLADIEENKHSDGGAVVGDISDNDTAAEALNAEETDTIRTATGRVKATPAVRAAAHKLGIDLAIVEGSGADGAISRKDLERAAKVLAVAAPAEPLSGVRRAMAEKMSRAHGEAVPASIHDDADVDDWVGKSGADVMVRLIRAVVAGCQAAPTLNAWFDGAKLERRLHKSVDLGIAVNTDEGLFVPTMRGVDKRSATELREGLERMKADVVKRTIPPEELRGQTITLSNFGTIVGKHAEMVVMSPQVAIFGAGVISEQVVAIAGKAMVRRIMPLSLTFDHRAATGGEAGAFLQAAIIDLEKPD